MELNHITYISAGAGSGKTYTLTSFLAKLITGEKKVQPEQFLLTTFTDAAAMEFKEKARAKLYECTDYEKYAEASERLNQAMIGTIDSVAYQFVLKYWYLLGISPNLKIVDEDTQNFFISQNLETILTEKEKNQLNDFVEMYDIKPPYNSGKYGLNYDFWKGYVRDLMKKGKSFITDMDVNLKASLAYSDELLGNWKLSYSKDDIYALLNELEDVAANQNYSAANEGRKSNFKEFKHKFSGKITCSELKQFRNYIAKLPGAFRGSPLYQAVYDSLAHIYDTKEVKDSVQTFIKKIFDLEARLNKKYSEYKTTRHLIDYEDIEYHFLKLLDEKEVQDDIRDKFRYVFVDEFQDSSPTQVKIFEKLSAIVGKDEDDDYEVAVGENKFKLHNSVWVGDFKQAIYGFRGADTELTKAVADIIEAKMKTCPKQFSMHSLDKSYRSYPDLVYKTNEIFEYSFNGILSPASVHLEPNRKQPEGFASLRIWETEGNKNECSQELCNQIEKLVLEKGDPSKIAVLAKRKDDYKDIVAGLKERGIPVSIETEIDTDCDEVQLVTALLRLVINPYDNYSRAAAVFLTEKDFDAGKVIDSKLLFSRDYAAAKTKADGKLPDYLADKKIISEFLNKYSNFNTQSIHSLVESLIIELDLSNVCRNLENSSFSDGILQSMEEAAGQYEEFCASSAIPPSIDGFISFLDGNLSSGGSKNGVTFMTIHSSKGLEWENVILLSLKVDDSDMKTYLKHEVYGVHVYHETAPSVENLYPPMIINLFPGFITFAGSEKVPDFLNDSIQKSKRFASQKETMISELRRLWYVAVTRARDAVYLVKEGDNPYAAFNLIGVPAAWETGFVNDKNTLQDGEAYAVPETPVISVNVNNTKITEKRNVQPSSYKGTELFKPETVYKSGDRIIFGKGNAESSEIGSCIHDIFCVLEYRKSEETCKKIISGYGLESVITDVPAVIKAWDNLAAYLEKEFGKALSVSHEMNFTQKIEGQIVNGSIDYVYRTSNGSVLIDFKTFPGKESDIINEGKHCAANYSGQFQCYEKALEAGGEKVIARLVYYPVGGLVVKLV